jgi:hypothetical protein
MHPARKQCGIADHGRGEDIAEFEEAEHIGASGREGQPSEPERLVADTSIGNDRHGWLPRFRLA